MYVHLHVHACQVNCLCTMLYYWCVHVCANTCAFTDTSMPCTHTTYDQEFVSPWYDGFARSNMVLVSYSKGWRRDRERG